MDCRIRISYQLFFGKADKATSGMGNEGNGLYRKNSHLWLLVGLVPFFIQYPSWYLATLVLI